MADVLSQSEIESLLSEMSDSPAKPGDAGSAAGAASTPLSFAARTNASHGIEIPQAKVVLPLSRRRMAAMTGRGSDSVYEAYDFRRSDKLAKEQLRSVNSIHENFARLFTSSISAYLRTTVQFELVTIEQVPYDEYIRSVSDSLINVLNIAQLSGQGLLDLNLRILFAMIDRLLGGIGEAHNKQGKDLTDVEKVLSRNIVRKALNDLEAAWHDVLPLKFGVASVESSSQFLQIVPNNDTIVLILFDLKLGDEQGTMSLAIPYMLLKPFGEHLNQQRWFSGSKQPRRQFAPKMMERLRSQTKVPCIARLGTSKITVGTLAGLEKGQILPLNLPPESRLDDGDADAPKGSLATVDLLVGDKPKFRGHIGLRDGKRLAVQISDFILPPPLLEVHKELWRNSDTDEKDE